MPLPTSASEMPARCRRLRVRTGSCSNLSIASSARTSSVLQLPLTIDEGARTRNATNLLLRVVY